MGVEMPRPDWDIDPGMVVDGPDRGADPGIIASESDWGGDPAFVRPTPGGLLDDLPEPHGGSGLELLMSPEKFASIDGLGTGSGDGNAAQDSEPRLLEAGDHSPQTAPHYPDAKADGDGGSIAGKVWNLPNSAIGLGVGALGYLAGWPAHWFGLQDAPGVTTGNNAVQFTHNPLMAPRSAITLGNVQVFNGEPGDPDGTGAAGRHEEQHTYQGEQLGPLYLPSNILGGVAGELIDGEWHGQHNWNEAGPLDYPPTPWPK